MDNYILNIHYILINNDSSFFINLLIDFFSISSSFIIPYFKYKISFMYLKVKSSLTFLNYFKCNKFKINL